MIIKSLTILRGFLEETIVEFNSGWNLVWSKNNSHGKTTLIRFILYSLGYKIPSTKKVDMNEYTTVLCINNKDGELLITRNRNLAIIRYADGTENKYNIDIINEQKTLQSIIFNINNPVLISNLLGALYIDQDKGWTLLNRGKTIASNSFDIQDFVACLTEKNTDKIDAEISFKEKEIKKYKAIFDVIEMSEEQKNEIKVDENIKKLLSRKNNLEILIHEKKDLLVQIKNVKENNVTLSTLIDSYKLMINFNNQKFILRKENIEDFIVNENIIKSKIALLEIEIKELERQLRNIIVELRKYDRLFNSDEVGDIVIQSIRNSNISHSQLNNLIEVLSEEKKNLKKIKKNIIQNANLNIQKLSDTIKEITTQLGVFEGFIKEEGNYLFTSNLKAYSGAILHKIVFSYRLSYYLFLKEMTGLEFPMFIDSPGSSEMKIDNIREILDLLKEKCGLSQVILSSIYGEELNIKFDKILEIENGLLSKKIY